MDANYFLRHAYSHFNYKAHDNSSLRNHLHCSSLFPKSVAQKQDVLYPRYGGDATTYCLPNEFLNAPFQTSLSPQSRPRLVCLNFRRLQVGNGSLHNTNNKKAKKVNHANVKHVNESGVQQQISMKHHHPLLATCTNNSINIALSIMGTMLVFDNCLVIIVQYLYLKPISQFIKRTVWKHWW